MKKVVSYLGKAILCCTTSLLAITSCEEYINEDYDLTKEIDMNATVLQGVSIPVGNAKALTVSDVLDLENVGGDVVIVDGKGDLKIVLEDQMRFEVPTKVFWFDYGLPDSQIFDNFAIEFPMPGVNIPENLLQGQTFSYSELTGFPLSVSSAMHFEAELPAEVKDYGCSDGMNVPGMLPS